MTPTSSLASASSLPFAMPDEVIPCFKTFHTGYEGRSTEEAGTLSKDRAGVGQQCSIVTSCYAEGSPQPQQLLQHHDNARVWPAFSAVCLKKSVGKKRVQPS